jgi:dihydrofolate reductase
MAKPFDLLLGRKTCDIFAAHWPYVGADDPIGPMFDRITEYVATRNPNLSLGWRNSQTLGTDVVAGVRWLKADDGPDLQTLLKNELVDEIIPSIFPVVLAGGKKLVGNGTSPAALKLASSKVSASGVTINRYSRGGPIATGSFQLEPPTEAELVRRKRLS